MAVDKDEVRRIARLAYLELPRVQDEKGRFSEPSDALLDDRELERLQAELNQILAYVEELKELDLEGVEPTSHGIPLDPLFRDDRADATLSTERALESAPKRVGDSFAVPKIIE